MKTITKRDFNRFLMKKGAFKRFYANKKAYYDRDYDRSINQKDWAHNWIVICGFRWCNTPEGYKYWQDIHRQWDDFVFQQTKYQY